MAHDGGVPPRGFSHRSFTIDLVQGGVNTREGVPVSLKGLSSGGFLALSGYFGINAIPIVQTQKIILIRNAAAANLCKCKKRSFVTWLAK
jgi:hypothetical protein